MTPRELLVHLIQEYEEEFKESPINDKETIAFRKGMIFAWRLALIRLDDIDILGKGIVPMKGDKNYVDDLLVDN